MASGPDFLRTEDVRAAFDALPTPLARLDSDLVILWANAAFSSLLGADRDTLAGAALTRAVTGAGGEIEEDENGAVVRLTGPSSDVWLRLFLTPTEGGALATLADITVERKALADMQATDWIRDQLMYDAEVGVWNYDPGDESYVFSHALNLGYPDSGARVFSSTLMAFRSPGCTAAGPSRKKRLVDISSARERGR